MSQLPGLTIRSLEHRRYVINHHPLVHGPDAILDRQARSPRAPVHRVLEGTVIVRVHGGYAFVDATDPRGARCAPAEVVALQPADAAWANTQLTLSLSAGLGFVVPLDAQATTTAAVVDQLNRNLLFVTHFLASDQGGLVRIRTREAGAHKHVLVESSLPAAFGPSGAAAAGTDADYRVTDATVEVRDLEGNPIEVLVPTLLVANFDASELLSLTPEARAVLSRRGSYFG
ncbi:MAG: hypothetical protein KIT58_04335 [Planctomycetota bacterium]|nr:hypothetical protein [Planctomycetota bacterium]